MMQLRFLVLSLLVLAIVGGVGAAEKATWTGTLVDSSCYLKDHSLTGNDHDGMKDCGTLCLKGGSPAGLLTQDKQFFAIIAPSTALAAYVGQTVRVSGELHNGSILANKVELKKGQKWEAVSLKPMM